MATSRRVLHCGLALPLLSIIAGTMLLALSTKGGVSAVRRRDARQSVHRWPRGVQAFHLAQRSRFGAAQGPHASVAFVHLADPHAFVLTSAGELRVFDVMDRDVPREIGDLPIAGEASVHAFGGLNGALYAQVSTATEHHLAIIDTMDPSRPRLVQTIPLTAPYAALFTGHQRILLGGKDGLLILDAADPLRPKEVGHYRQTDVGIRGLAADSRRVFALATILRCPESDETRRGLLELSLGSDAWITGVRAHCDPKMERADHVAMAGGALAIGGAEGFLTWMTDPRSVLPFGPYESPTLPWLGEWSTASYAAVIGRGPMVYAVRTGRDGQLLRVIDFFDAEKPVEQMTFDLMDETVSWIDAEGELVAVGVGRNGVLLLTQHDPRAPIATMTAPASSTPTTDRIFLPHALRPRTRY